MEFRIYPPAGRAGNLEFFEVSLVNLFKIMQSFLITGSDEKGRLLEAEKFIGKKLSSLENNPDFIILQTGEGSSIGIAEVKNLQEKLALKPFQEKKKIALIKEAQNLTFEAQNALLKILEEPGPESLIILTAPDSFFLLPTVSSRCQIVPLPKKTELDISEEELSKNFEFLNRLFDAGKARRLKIVEEESIVKNKETAEKWLNKFAFSLRYALLSSYQIPSSQITKLSLKTQNLPPEKVKQYLKILKLINQYLKYLSANCNVRLCIENFVLELPEGI